MWHISVSWGVYLLLQTLTYLSAPLWHYRATFSNRSSSRLINTLFPEVSYAIIREEVGPKGSSGSGGSGGSTLIPHPSIDDLLFTPCCSDDEPEEEEETLTTAQWSTSSTTTAATTTTTTTNAVPSYKKDC